MIKNLNKIAACTYFDKNYLVKGLSMCTSFTKHNPEVRLLVLCFDDYTKGIVDQLKIKNVSTIKLADFEDKDLLKVKNDRSMVEYYWTCTPSLPLYIFKKYPKYEKIIYLDADLFFFSKIDSALVELADGAIYTVEHRFPAWQSFRSLKTGRFNVGFQIFTRHGESIRCLKRWRRQCLDWCYFRVEDGKMADQLYLNEWPFLYKDLVISGNIGINVAPWNILQYSVTRKDRDVWVNNQKIICYHFHQFNFLNEDSFELSYAYIIPRQVRAFIYKPYIESLKEQIKKIKYIDSNFFIAPARRSLYTKAEYFAIKFIAPIFWFIQSLRYTGFHKNKAVDISEINNGMNKLSSREINEKEHFNKMSALYDENYGYNKQFTQYKINKKSLEFVKFVRKFCNVKSPVILELGCGTGEYTVKIATELPNGRFIGNDISGEMIKEARKKSYKLKNVSYKVESAYHTSLKKESVDIVCGFYALHHFDFKKTANEAARILKKGGLVFFYEPNILNPMVFLIKSNKTLKQLVGDSPDEWGINPLTIEKYFPGFQLVKISSTEFIWPIPSFSFVIMKYLDKLTSVFSKIPMMRFLGGSLAMGWRKT